MLWLRWKYGLWGASENQLYDKTKRCTNDTKGVQNKIKFQLCELLFLFLDFVLHFVILIWCIEKISFCEGEDLNLYIYFSLTFLKWVRRNFDMIWHLFLFIIFLIKFINLKVFSNFYTIQTFKDSKIKQNDNHS